jgi:multicomponent Na+:H+ antiporter subunit G
MVLFILGTILVSLGVVFFILGSIGLLRMPDVFNKLQAGTKATTLGFISIALGVLLMKPEFAPKIVVILLFVLISNPIGSHALARASRHRKEKMVTGKTTGKDTSDILQGGKS